MCILFIIFIVLCMHMCTRVCVWRSGVFLYWLSPSVSPLMKNLSKAELHWFSCPESSDDPLVCPQRAGVTDVWLSVWLSFFSSFVSYKVFLLSLFKLKLLLCNIFWLCSFLSQLLPGPPHLHLHIHLHLHLNVLSISFHHQHHHQQQQNKNNLISVLRIWTQVLLFSWQEP